MAGPGKGRWFGPTFHGWKATGSGIDYRAASGRHESREGTPARRWKSVQGGVNRLEIKLWRAR
jgi:hypothetical protein